MQSVPYVSKADVERIIRRDFLPEFHDRVRSELSRYRRFIVKGANDKNRVKLAILRLADGNHEKIKSLIVAAKGDFRDVIAPAEYPRLDKIGFVGVEKLTRKERSQLIEDDWRDYQEWFSGGTEHRLEQLNT